jgi:hypothetical protein
MLFKQTNITIAQKVVVLSYDNAKVPRVQRLKDLAGTYYSEITVM